MHCSCSIKQVRLGHRHIITESECVALSVLVVITKKAGVYAVMQLSLCWRSAC